MKGRSFSGGRRPVPGEVSEARSSRSGTVANIPDIPVDSSMSCSPKLRAKVGAKRGRGVFVPVDYSAR